MKVEFEDLTEEEKAVFEEYRKEKAELEKTDKARYEELQCAVNNIITALSPQEHFIFKEAFKVFNRKILFLSRVFCGSNIWFRELHL